MDPGDSILLLSIFIQHLGTPDLGSTEQLGRADRVMRVAGVLGSRLDQGRSCICSATLDIQERSHMSQLRRAYIPREACPMSRPDCPSNSPTNHPFRQVSTWPLAPYYSTEESPFYFFLLNNPIIEVKTAQFINGQHGFQSGPSAVALTWAIGEPRCPLGPSPSSGAQFRFRHRW